MSLVKDLIKSNIDMRTEWIAEIQHQIVDDKSRIASNEELITTLTSDLVELQNALRSVDEPEQLELPLN